MIQTSNPHIYHQGDDSFGVASMKKYLDQKYFAKMFRDHFELVQNYNFLKLQVYL